MSRNDRDLARAEWERSIDQDARAATVAVETMKKEFSKRDPKTAPTEGALPIGAVFMTVEAGNPAQALGYGTWKGIALGLVGVNCWSRTA